MKNIIGGIVAIGFLMSVSSFGIAAEPSPSQKTYCLKVHNECFGKVFSLTSSCHIIAKAQWIKKHKSWSFCGLENGCTYTVLGGSKMPNVTLDHNFQVTFSTQTIERMGGQWLEKVCLPGEFTFY